jgi:hypothetical protein
MRRKGRLRHPSALEPVERLGGATERDGGATGME